MRIETQLALVALARWYNKGPNRAWRRGCKTFNEQKMAQDLAGPRHQTTEKKTHPKNTLLRECSDLLEAGRLFLEAVATKYNAGATAIWEATTDWKMYIEPEPKFDQRTDIQTVPTKLRENDHRGCQNWIHLATKEWAPGPTQNSIAGVPQN